MVFFSFSLSLFFPFFLFFFSSQRSQALEFQRTRLCTFDDCGPFIFYPFHALHPFKFFSGGGVGMGRGEKRKAEERKTKITFSVPCLRNRRRVNLPDRIIIFAPHLSSLAKWQIPSIQQPWISTIPITFAILLVIRNSISAYSFPQFFFEGDTSLFLYRNLEAPWRKHL